STISPQHRLFIASSPAGGRRCGDYSSSMIARTCSSLMSRSCASFACFCTLRTSRASSESRISTPHVQRTTRVMRPPLPPPDVAECGDDRPTGLRAPCSNIATTTVSKASTSMDPLRVCVCGRLSIEHRGAFVREADLPARQGRRLWAFLVLRRRLPVAREEIAEAVWGDDTPDAWDVALN